MHKMNQKNWLPILLISLALATTFAGPINTTDLDVSFAAYLPVYLSLCLSENVYRITIVDGIPMASEIVAWTFWNLGESFGI